LNLQLHGISLGLVHLHSHHVVHGDLKAVSGSTSQAIYAVLTASHVLFQANVLVDDGANAVLCDFGLSRVKDDTMGLTVGPHAGEMIGSRNWMAPERLMGGLLKTTCDIYAFAMTLYEVSLVIPLQLPIWNE
jgi:serine/threonine protein kinase